MGVKKMILETYKEALLKYNMMLLQNESIDNIEYQIRYIRRLENEIQDSLNSFEHLKNELKDKNNTNYYRVSYNNGKKRQNYRYQYTENGKAKMVVRNTIEELETEVKNRGLPWFNLGGNEE